MLAQTSANLTKSIERNSPDHLSIIKDDATTERDGYKHQNKMNLSKSVNDAKVIQTEIDLNNQVHQKLFKTTTDKIHDVLGLCKSIDADDDDFCLFDEQNVEDDEHTKSITHRPRENDRRISTHNIEQMKEL